jgi:hypothetical protein
MRQEQLIQESTIPSSIVRATQFYEFVQIIAGSATDGDTVRISSALVPGPDATVFPTRFEDWLIENALAPVRKHPVAVHEEVDHDDLSSAR